MPAFIVAFVSSAITSLYESIQVIALSALIFAWLALVIKGRAAMAAFRLVRHELPVNLSLFVLDALLVAPLLAFLVAAIRLAIDTYSLALLGPSLWPSAPGPLTLFAVLFVGDFVSYFRHRLEHSRLLWPAHAVHHSDTAMTWLTIVRFHPLNRVTTVAVDTTCLALLGFPEWALISNVIVRHFYGEFIHANFRWTYGPLGRLFVSPVMHRWHHARDVQGSGSNFASVFSVFDQVFGTYYVPGPCDVPLGVRDSMGRGTFGQLSYPFVAWKRQWHRRKRAQIRLNKETASPLVPE